MPAKPKTLPTTVIEDGRVLDCITDRAIKDSPKEVAILLQVPRDILELIP